MGLIFHCQEQVAGDIDLYVHPDKTDFMCFYRYYDHPFNGKPLKLVGQFAKKKRSNISSTEKNVIISRVKAWTTSDRLTNTWRSDPSDKMKSELF